MHLCHQHALSNQWVGKIIIHYSVIVFTFKYNKMCKVNLEKEQVTHESQADCLPLVRQMKQNSWTILSEKQGKVLSHFCLVLILKYWGSCQQFHDLLILGTLQFENSSSSYHGPGSNPLCCIMTSFRADLVSAHLLTLGSQPLLSLSLLSLGVYSWSLQRLNHNCP